MSNLSLRILLVLVTVGVVITVLGFVMCAPAYSEGSIGLSYSQVPGEVSIGSTLNYEKEIDLGKLDLSAQAQKGDLLLADIHLGFNFDLGKFGVNPYVDANLKGAELFDEEDNIALGGKIDYGATINFSGHETSEVGLGIFLRNASPFSSPPTATWVDGEWVRDTEFGINYDNPSRLNILGYKKFEFGRFDIKLSGSYGFDDQRDIWAVLDVNTDFDLQIAELNLGLNIGNRWYTTGSEEEENLKDASESDVALIATITRSW